MAIINKLSNKEIKENFTHYANLHGVPIYFNVETQGVCVRNWIPEFFLDAGEFMYSLFVQVMMVDQPCYAIKLKGEIK